MRSIAVINQKGGVGKTTTAVNLAAALAANGRRVCVVDLDPQAHATLHLSAALDGVEPPHSVYDLLVGDATLADVRTQAGENLWLVNAHIDLAAVEIELAALEGRELILRRKLEQDSLELDYLVIDCPPSLGILTLNALSAAEEVLIPLQPHFLALHGLSKLLETIQWAAGRVNPRLRLAGVVLCMYESATRLAAEVAGDVEEFLKRARDQSTPWSEAKVFTTRIRRNIRLAEAPSFGKSILEYAPESHGAEDYLCLAEELIAATQPAIALANVQEPPKPITRGKAALV